MVKNEERFDVLLIDFVYEFDENDEIHNSDVEFRIQIKPLLQQSFSRSTDKTGAYTWAKTTTTNKYYVSNPRFISVVKNENALNYLMHIKTIFSDIKNKYISLSLNNLYKND